MLVGLIREYQKGGSPIHVSFRELVPWLRLGERATHYLHSYPAKLLPQICHFFLAAEGWLPKDALVLDPFCGTGTIPLEANLSGRTAIYADANPLARLITRAKTSPVDLQLVEATLLLLESHYRDYDGGYLPWIVNVDHWYTPKAKLDLTRLRRAIVATAPAAIEDFIWATFSATARKCSLANPRFAVPVLDKGARLGGRQRDVWQVFADQYRSNAIRHAEFQALTDPNTSSVSGGTDARKLTMGLGGDTEPLPDCSVDLILTSPPYAGAQKYVRASSLSLGWLGLTGPKTLKALENASIGREHFLAKELSCSLTTGIDKADEIIERIRSINPVRATICATYLFEMREAVKEFIRVLKPGGRVVLIIGDNTVCGMPFESSLYLQRMLENEGMTLHLKLVDEIKSRGLLTKRRGGADAIKSETILVFTK